MKNNQEATHDHKRAGTVVVLESTAVLAKVLISTTGDEFWVKLTDLTLLTDLEVDKRKPTKRLPGKIRPATLANGHSRAGRPA